MSQSYSEPKYAVVWPLGRRDLKPLRVQGPIADLRGKTVGQLWDRLFRGDEIFAVIREKLQERYPDVKFVSYDVFGNIQGPDEPDVIAALPELLRRHGCDVVITGIGA